MPVVIEQYVGWLLKVYASRFGRPPIEPDVEGQAVAILRGHAATRPGCRSGTNSSPWQSPRPQSD